MTDARLIWEDINGGDVKIDPETKDLSIDDGLATAVLISLFSDGRAPSKEDLPLGETRFRGWWPDSEDDRFGSLLWLVAREKVTNETRERLREYAQQALSWIIRDGIAESVTVTATSPAIYTIILNIDIYRGTATESQNLWDNIEDYNGSIVLSDTIKSLDISLRFV